MTVVLDDKDRLVIECGVQGWGKMVVTPHEGHMKITTSGMLVGGTVVHIDRDDAVALRDWINAALTSGAIRDRRCTP